MSIGIGFVLVGCSDEHILSHGDYTYDSVILYQNDLMGHDVYLKGFLRAEPPTQVAIYPTREEYLILDVATEFLVGAPIEELKACAGSYVVVTGTLKKHEHGGRILVDPLIRYFPYIHKVGDEHKPPLSVPENEAIELGELCYDGLDEGGESYPPDEP